LVWFGFSKNWRIGGDRQQVLGLGSENRLSAIRKILINLLKANATLYKSFCEK
jgi:hypothetical protein